MFVLSGVDALRFRGNNINEYGIFVGPTQSLTAFAVSFWMNTSTKDSDKSVLSYAYTFRGEYVDNGLLIYFNPDLTIIFHAFVDVTEKYIRYFKAFFLYLKA
jgi:hypothetical protein